MASAAGELKATNPVPKDGATGVTMLLLQWTPGATALWHDVYIGLGPELGSKVGRQVAVMSMYFYNVNLPPGATVYWRIDEVEANGTTIHTGDVWSFTTLGPTAYDPNPADGATGVSPSAKLTWMPGEGALAHNVFFGLSETLVAQGEGDTFKGKQVAPSYDPGTLTLGTTYYWRIDEVMVARPPGSGGVIRGPVWRFTTKGGAAETPIHYVDGKKGSDDNDGLSLETAFATIQKGIDSAFKGDTVLVYPGIYREPINFLGKAITVRSADHPAVLAVGAEFAVSFYEGEGRTSVLENFVIRDSFLGIFIVQSSPTLRNLTVAKNKYGLEAYGQTEPDVVNCIFWDNTADDLFGCNARYSCIERGSEGLGNFSSDPLFVDPNGKDFHLRSERGRYWPKYDVWVLDKVTSPCINAGDPQSDYSKEPKPNGGRINLGAYGGTAYASLSEAGQPGNSPPTIVITSPADGTAFTSSPQTIRIEAEASDIDGSVVKVEFFADGEKIGEDTNGSDGWAMDWTGHPLNYMSGSRDLRARATDDDGASTDSLPVRVHSPMKRR
jgi:hypothetical protein